MIKTIKIWIYGLTLTYGFFFFSLYSILGIQFEGSENSSTYIYGTAFFSTTSLVFGLFSLFKYRYIRRISLFFISLPIILTLLYIFENANTEFALKYYLIFISIVFPMIIIGLDLAKSKSLDQLYYPLFFTFIIITLGCVRIFPQLISTKLNELIGLGGGGTQQMSYAVSFAYMIGLITINDSERFKKKIYLKLLIYISLIILFFSALLASGRGAFLVILISSSIFIWRNFKKKFFTILIGAIVPIYLIFNFLLEKIDTRLIASIDRIFSYIDNFAINMDGSSNRGWFFENAISLFYENILFGHGVFGITVKEGGFYSHNIFLDILVHGGIILMLIFIFLVFLFFKKLFKILKFNSNNKIILIFIIYSFTFLLFSGQYIIDGFFWFSLAYVFSYSFKSVSENKNLIDKQSYRPAFNK